MELSGRMLATRVAVLLLSIAAVQGACDEQTSQKTCVNDADGCLWQVTADTSGDQSSECVSCSTYDDDAWLCVSPCTYHESSGQCSISSPASMPTAAPVSTTADTGVLAMTLRLEMPTYILSDDQMDAVDSILAEVMAAQTATSVDSDSVDAETCGYAPLCGTANNMITVLPTNSDEIDITFSSMDPCCPARDTAPVEDCEIVNLEGEACRVAGIQVPVCSDLTNPTQACLALSENPDQASLTISSLTYTDGGATGGCCETCTCYGDPNCVSFNGTEASWRVCDGRDTTTKNCKITQSACKSVEDTNGAACLWKPSTWESTWQSGSKCQPAADGEPSWLLMYKADDFEFWVRQEERGVIREAMMYTSDANFSLDATSCIEETSLSSSWTLEGSSSWPSYTANWVRKDSNETFDVVWYIVDGSTNIQVSIACTGTVDPSDANKVLSKQTYGNYRINIDAVIEPLESWNTTRSNLDGFCYTSSLLGNNASQTEIAALQAHREIEAACKAKGIVYDTDEAREFARTICTSYTTNQSVQICFAFFCKNYASLAQSSIDAETCVDYFEALDVTNGFCRVAYSSDALISKCINEINEFGYSEIVAEFLNNVGAETTTCISSLENLTTSLTSCQEGITLQYQATAGDDDSWTDYAAFPASRGLCDQELQVPYIGNEVLFTHPIRFQQCSRDSSCGVVEQCNWIDGVSMDLSFSLPQQVNSVTTSPSAYSCSDYCAEDVTMETGVDIDSDVCTTEITFTSSDIDASSMCADCDFTGEESIRESGDGYYVSLGDSCDLADSDTTGLEEACAQICFLLLDADCDAWILKGGDCFLYSCENDTATFVDGSSVGGGVCRVARGVATPAPSQMPTLVPTASPFPTSTDSPISTSGCVQSVCPSDVETPEVQTSIVINETVCAHDIMFSASDLNASDFCYSCDFSSDNILQTSDGNGNYIDMTAACDLTTDDTDDLDAVCAHVCAQFDGCDAWVIAGGNCFIFACDNDEASFTSGSYRGAAACPGTTTCVQSVCPAGDDTPEVQTSIVIDETVCAHDITFSASDLNASDFCYSCDFSSDNILQTSDGNGNYIDMTAACDLTTDDTDDLDAVCAHVCAQFDGCDAWVIAGGNCFIFACDNDVSFASGSYRGAAACPSSPTTAPTLLPTMAPTLTPTETPTRSPSGSPTLLPTMAPTLTPTETPTRSPSGSPTKAPTSRPTKSPTRSPTQAPTRSPTQAPTHSPTQAPTHSPTQAPTRSPTQAPTHSPTKSPTSAPTQTPTTQSFGWTRRLDEEEDGSNVKLITSVEDSSTVPRRALSRRGFAAAASRKTALNPSGALTPRMTRRELTPGMTEFYITSYLMYTDASSAESARDDTANYYGNTMEVLREAFASSSAFSDYSDTLNVTGVTTSLNYDYYILRFDVPYVASEHDAEDFLAGICFVVQRTVYRTKSKHKMGTLKCDVNLFNFTSYAESDSDLAIHFRIESSKVSAGEFQTLFARSSTRTTFNNVIEQCGSNSVEECDVSAITNLVSTLKASFASSDPDEDGSSGGLSSAGIAVVVVALVAAVVVAVGAVVWRRRRIQKRELSMSRYEVGPKHGFFFDEDEDSRA